MESGHWTVCPGCGGQRWWHNIFPEAITMIGIYGHYAIFVPCETCGGVGKVWVEKATDEEKNNEKPA